MLGCCYSRYAGEARLDGKTAIITGCNCGIGKFTAMDFFKRGCRVIMACRDATKAQATRKEIMQEALGLAGTGTLVIRTLNLASLQSVRNFVNDVLSEEKEINYLINNAGVVMSQKEKTEDGFELQFGTNHLGHFLLTILLLPRIIASAPARIVTVSSIIYKYADPIDWDDLNGDKSYSPTKNYFLSKLANIWFTQELAKRLAGTKVNVYAVHPGLVKTEATRHFDKLLFPGFEWFCQKIVGLVLADIGQGAATTLYCALDKKTLSETGLYYENCNPVAYQAQATDKEKAKKMWEVSWDLVQLGDFDPFQQREL